MGFYTDMCYRTRQGYISERFLFRAPVPEHMPTGSVIDTVETIETQTCGMPTRIITDGIETIEGDGSSVAAQRDAFVERSDETRKLLVMEPRGHDDMFCAALVEPARPDADVGAFFMNAGGCDEDVCIHGIIGIVTALVETERLAESDSVRIETPAGTVTTRPTIDDGRVTAVAVESVASYVCEEDVSVRTPDAMESLSVDVVYSGNAFAMVDADDVGLSITPDTVPDLVKYGERVLAALRDDESLETGPSDEVNAVSIYEGRPDADRNFVVAPGGHVDRSPSGTGTAALMVLRHHEGNLDVDEQYSTESVIGTTFGGRLYRRGRSNGEPEVVPEVTGSAYLVAEHRFFRDPDDPIIGFRGLNNRFAPFEMTTVE